ncbi:MAG: hypothetical protein ACYCV7_17030, partial [Acidimicrobiales bacterium]
MSARPRPVACHPPRRPSEKPWRPSPAVIAQVARQDHLHRGTDTGKRLHITRRQHHFSALEILLGRP